MDYNTGAWRGIAAPLNIPQEAATAMSAALKRVFDSSEYKEFLNNRGFGLVYADAASFGKHLEAANASLGDAMKSAGLAKA